MVDSVSAKPLTIMLCALFLLFFSAGEGVVAVDVVVVFGARAWYGLWVDGEAEFAT